MGEGDADGVAGGTDTDGIADGEGCGVTCSRSAKTIENRATVACIRWRAVASLRRYYYTEIMIAGSLTYDEAGQLLERCIALYNAGVRTRDFSGFLALLTEDAVLEFEGIPERGPLTGKNAIAQHLRDDPPDDELKVTRWKTDGAQIVAQFSWTDIPESGGCLLVRARDSRAEHITIVLGGPRRAFR